MKKNLKLIILLLLALVLLAGPVRAKFAPKQINEYENRYANQLVKPGAASFADGSFQDGMELALADQLPGAEPLKRAYNNHRSSFLRTFLPLITGGSADNPYGKTYVALDDSGTFVYGDTHLCIGPRLLEGEVKSIVDWRIANLNDVIAANPGIDFYAYYIESDPDIDLETGKKTGSSSYILNALNLPSSQKACFELNSADEFDELFYLTDHHWNLHGSYAAYKQLHELLSMDGDILVPAGEYEIGEFSGSRASGAYSGFSEMFCAYDFYFPQRRVEINAVNEPDYGGQWGFLTGNATVPVTYANYYGYDAGEVAFFADTGNGDSDGEGAAVLDSAVIGDADGAGAAVLDSALTGYADGAVAAVLDSALIGDADAAAGAEGAPNRRNILILGESYDNAILKLIASHYDELYAVDLRYYSVYFGHEFDFEQYVAEHDIGTVLFIGSNSYFSSPDFAIKREVR